MSANECRCGKPTRDNAYSCDHRSDQLAHALTKVPWLDDELETTTTGTRGVDYTTIGGSTISTIGETWKGDRPDLGAHIQPAPVHWGASDARTHLQALLVSWVLFCDAESIRNSSPYPGRPTDTDGEPTDDLVTISAWLHWRVDGLALHEIGPDAVDEIVEAITKCEGIIDRRPDKWFAGPCNEPDDNEIVCGADLYAASSKGAVECRDCGTTYDVAARRAWLLEAAHDRLADASTLARAVSWLGAEPLNGARVRKWAERGRITAKGHDGAKPLYRIGDAITLMAADTKAS